LIDKKADVNAQDKWKKTALSYAVDNQNSEIVKLLIDKEVDVNAKTAQGWPALIVTRLMV